MVELVYTQDLKSCGRKPLRVRVPLPAFLAQKKPKWWNWYTRMV